MMRDPSMVILGLTLTAAVHVVAIDELAGVIVCIYVRVYGKMEIAQVVNFRSLVVKSTRIGGVEWERCRC